MTGNDLGLLAMAAGLVLLAGLFSAADAALGSFSPARAEELADEGRTGATRLVRLLQDSPRYLNTALFLRLLCEISAIVLVTLIAYDSWGSWWPAVMIAVGVMLVASFVVIGVAPRTIGRQHAQRVALASAGPLMAVTTHPRPAAAAADPGRQRDHPRQGLPPGARSRRRPSCASSSTSPRRRR